MKKILLITILCTFLYIPVQAQRDATVHHLKSRRADSVQQSRQPRLQLGGYGEVVYQRMFYSDDVARYTYPQNHKNKNHGRFNLPHVVFYVGYDFGRGWKMGSEVEFEYGGTGSTYEIENAETGEYETEIEKGGEVVLEQFWIEKSWFKQLNLRLGHIIVPVGLTNMYHMPTEFFSVLRPEEDMALIPCTWHETGASIWGNAGKWRYEAMFIAGLDAERFSRDKWVADGAVSPYEFKIANNYAGAFRVDNYSVKGLRMGLSGYVGASAGNTLKPDRYNKYKGLVTIGAFDAVYDDHNVLARGSFLYGHLGDSEGISETNRRMPSASPSSRTYIGSDAMSWYVEAGYDIMSFFGNRKYRDDKLYVWAHYGYYHSMYKVAEKVTQYKWCEKRVISAGVNYFPMKGLVIKAEYSYRQFDPRYNNEPTFSIGVGYSGLFSR